FRENRYSHRIAGPFDRMRHWPGPRYYALHTLSHQLIRTIALERGYRAASLGERSYAGTAAPPQPGNLLYTAAPPADGTRRRLPHLHVRVGNHLREGEPVPGSAVRRSDRRSEVGSLPWCP